MGAKIETTLLLAMASKLQLACKNQPSFEGWFLLETLSNVYKTIDTLDILWYDKHVKREEALSKAFGFFSFPECFC